MGRHGQAKSSFFDATKRGNPRRVHTLIWQVSQAWRRKSFQPVIEKPLLQVRGDSALLGISSSAPLTSPVLTLSNKLTFFPIPNLSEDIQLVIPSRPGDNKGIAKITMGHQQYNHLPIRFGRAMKKRIVWSERRS